MSTDQKNKINLVVNSESKPYWEGAAKGQLLIRTCNACGKAHYYPRTICPHCFSEDTAFVEASGSGVIYSYSVTRQAKPPYVYRPAVSGRQIRGREPLSLLRGSPTFHR